MNWFRRIFTLPRAQKAALGALIDHQIDSIFDHNPPDQVDKAIVKLLSASPIGEHLLGGLPLVVAISQLDPILQRNTGAVARSKVKLWARGRLGL